MDKSNKKIWQINFLRLYSNFLIQCGTCSWNRNFKSQFAYEKYILFCFFAKIAGVINCNLISSSVICFFDKTIPTPVFFYKISEIQYTTNSDKFLSVLRFKKFLIENGIVPCLFEVTFASSLLIVLLLVFYKFLDYDNNFNYYSKTLGNKNSPALLACSRVWKIRCIFWQIFKWSQRNSPQCFFELPKY